MNEFLDLFLKDFKKKYPKGKLLFLYVAGSHFFDLHSEKSDKDFRGVYLPSLEDFYNDNRKETHRVWDFKTNKKGKNSNEDVDFTLFSLPKYLELLKHGDFNVMESLYTPDNKVLFDSDLMKEVRTDRENLLVKDIGSFMGFFKKEYKKYGVNIYHHKYREDFVEFLKTLSLKKGVRLQAHWDDIKKFGKDNPNHLKFLKTKTGLNVEHPTIEIGSRLFQWRVKVNYVIEELGKSLATAGHRQKNMAEHGKEFKGLYHAQRLLFESKELLTKHRLTFPLPKEQHELLKRIKEGNIEKEDLFNKIEESYKEIQDLEKDFSYNNKTIISHIEKIEQNLTAKMKLAFIEESY